MVMLPSMTDIASISAALSSAKTATDIIKMIGQAGLSLSAAQNKANLAELANALSDIKLQLAGIKLHVIERDQTIASLKEALKIKEKLEWQKPFYWLKENNRKDGPYCQQCYDSKQNLIRLQDNGKGNWYCHTCKTGYRDGTHERPTRSETDYDPFS